jgi:hypothetical protein
MVKVNKLPILLIRRGVNVEKKNDVETAASLLSTKQQRKSSKRTGRNGQTIHGNRTKDSNNINF